MDEGRRRNVFTLGVSVTMLPTRSCPRQFAVRGDAEVVAETGTADDPRGDGVGAAGVPAAGVAGEVRPVVVVEIDVLLTDVWGYRYTGGTRTVDVHVRRLREKLPSLEQALVTVKQFGYKLADNEVT